MHAKVFRERCFFIPRGTGRCGGQDGGRGKQRMQEDADLFICMFVAKRFEWVCLHVCRCFCMEEEERDAGGFHQTPESEQKLTFAWCFM